MLGKEDDPKGAGYNVNQSKIAIGSGGLIGKGFLQGTQTKYNFVPEQSTDFIFCTVGEEWGFVGSAVVILLFVFLLIQADEDGGATTVGFQPYLWIRRSIHPLLPFCGQYRDDHRPCASDRDPAAFLQLWRIFLMGVYHPAFYFHQAGCEPAGTFLIEIQPVILILAFF